MHARKQTNIRVPAGLNFEKVEIFRLVKGRLPEMVESDSLTQEILDDFCRKYRAGELKQGIVPLDYLDLLIQTGEIKVKE